MPTPPTKPTSEPVSPRSSQSLQALREMIAKVERRPAPKLSRPVAEQQEHQRLLPFEVADVDAALQGGMEYDVLQEALPARTE